MIPNLDGYFGPIESEPVGVAKPARRHRRARKLRPSAPFAFWVQTREFAVIEARNLIAKILCPRKRFVALRRPTYRHSGFTRFPLPPDVVSLTEEGTCGTITGVARYVGESGRGAISGNADDLKKYIGYALAAAGFRCQVSAWRAKDETTNYPKKLRRNAKIFEN